MISKIFNLIVCAGLAAALLSLDPALLRGAMAAGADDDSPPGKLELAQRAIGKGDYQAAIDSLAGLERDSPGDPDVLNLLGYSHRKLGRIEQAREYYLKALAIKPNHRGANEYLGELYLEVGDLPKAQERLAVLDDECFFPCEEYTELKQAVQKYKTANGIK